MRRAWYVGLACVVCRMPVLVSGKSEAASFHFPHDDREPYAVHAGCREDAAER